MNFDDRRAQFGGHLDLGRSCTDEQRNADARMLELANDGSKLRALAGDVEPAFGRALGALFRHEAGRMRPRLERDVDHFVGRRHFKIERLVDLALSAARCRRREYAGGPRADAR